MPRAVITTERSGLKPGQVTADVNKAVIAALKEAADEGAAVARGIASQRKGDPSKRPEKYRSLPHMSDITAGRVFGTEDGWGVIVRSHVFWSKFHDKGTVKLPALRFMAAGQRAARARFLPALSRRL